MRLEIIRIIFRKEVKELLRDRRSMAIMFGIPLVLYPLLTLAAASLGQSKQKELTEKPVRIAITNPEDAPGLIELLKKEDSGFDLREVDDPAASLASDGLDAIIDLPPNAQADALASRDVKITFRLDRSRTAAEFTLRRLSRLIEVYQRQIIEHRLQQAGVSPDVLKPIETTTTDVARAEQRMGNRLAMLLPVLLMVTGMVGALFPALSATTTERELGTLETLLVSPAGRMEMLLAKGLLVLLCAMLTAGLNMISMALVLWRVFSGANLGMGDFSLDPIALLLAYLSSIPALIVFTTIVLIVGMLARNFREANAFATPMMLVPLMSLAVTMAEPKSSPALLITPIVNTTIIIRDVLTDRVSAWPFIVAFGSSCVYATLLLGVAVRLFSNEQLVNPSWEPVSFSGLRRAGRRPRRLPAIDEAIALFAVSLLLLFYISPSLVKQGLFAILIVNELLLILAPALLFAWLARWKWRDTFNWRPSSLAALIGATLIGVGIAPWINLVTGLQRSVWPADPESSRAQAEVFLPVLANHPILTIIVVGALAGICEELFYRGPIQTALSRRSPWIGITVAAALFAGIHMDVHGFAIRFVIGMLLGWMTWRSASIFPAMLAHGIYDSTQLSFAAWTIRKEGVDQVMKNAEDMSLTLTTADMVALAVAVIFVIAGWFLFRRNERIAN